MNFYRNALVSAAKACAENALDNSPSPYPRCARIFSRDGTIRMLSDNHQVSIEVNLGLVAEGLDVWVDAKQLYRILSGWTKDTVGVAVTGDAMKLTGDGTFSLPKYLLEAAPGTEDSNSLPVTIPSIDLNRYLTEVSVAVAKENSRYSINGIHIFSGGDGIDFVATDGRRLHLARHKDHSGVPLSFIMPASACKPLASLVGDVKIAPTTGGGMVFMDAERTVHVLGIAEKFPPYRQVIPAKGSRTWTGSAKSLADACKRAMVTTSVESLGATLSFGPESTVSTQGDGVGSSDIPIGGSYTGEEMEMILNPVFLLHALRACDGDVEISMTESHKPALLTSGQFTAVLMPIRKA